MTFSDDNKGMEIDSVIVTDIHRSLSIQTDLTMQDLRSMEYDNQKCIEEVQTLQGYSS